MSNMLSASASGSVRPIFGAIRSVPVPVHQEADGQAPPLPFITISRQPGAGAVSLGRELVEHLNQIDPHPRPWSLWDRELVEKVAAEHHLPANVVDRLEEGRHGWFDDFLRSLAFSPEASAADEDGIYQRVSQTMRALAQLGRVVLVGRGGVYITRKLPGGIHLRLVAPLEWRIAHMAQLLECESRTAARKVDELERNRQAFYRRFWPKETLACDNFTLSLNTAGHDEQQLVRCILPLIPVEAAVAR